MTTRVLVSYGASILILCVLIEVLWGATGGVLGGLAIARDPAYRQELEAFFKQKGLTASTPAEMESAMAKLSLEDRAALRRITANLMKRHHVGGFGMAFFVSAAAFGIAAFIAGYFSRVWQYAWSMVAASFLLNNPFRRFGLVAEMPAAQKAAVVLVAQLGVSFGAAWMASRLALRRKRHEPTQTPSENA